MGAQWRGVGDGAEGVREGAIGGGAIERRTGFLVFVVRMNIYAYVGARMGIYVRVHIGVRM